MSSEHQPTLQRLAGERHPGRTPAPLDATTPADLILDAPAVLVEVDGAREGLDALDRVRRCVERTSGVGPIAAVRLAALDDLPSGRRRLLRRLPAALTLVAAVVLGVVGAVRIADDVPGRSTLATTLLLAAAPVLGVVAARSWRRARRAPVERRRYRERHRSRALIAVLTPGEREAASLAGAIRRELAEAPVLDGPCRVSVHARRPDTSA